MAGKKELKSLTPPTARRAIVSVLFHFDELKDPRVERGKRHPLVNVIVLALLATICGADGWDDIEEYAAQNAEWLGEILDLPDGETPSDDTFRRVLEALRPDVFAQCVHAWMAALCGSLEGKTIPIDGKTLRRSFDRAGGLNPLHVVEAWVAENRVVLGQVVAEDGDEFGAIVKLVETFNMKGALLTLDAGGCHRELCARILAAEADYLMAVKGNEPTLHKAIGACFEDGSVGRTFETRTDGHGRTEIRRVRVLPARQLGAVREQWAGVGSIACVDRIRSDEGILPSVSRVLYISSLSIRDAERLATSIRAHWTIENTLHWTLDVAFREDEQRVRDRASAANLALIRRTALTLLKNHHGKRKHSIRSKRWVAGMKPSLALAILCGTQVDTKVSTS